MKQLTQSELEILKCCNETKKMLGLLMEMFAVGIVEVILSGKIRQEEKIIDLL